MFIKLQNFNIIVMITQPSRAEYLNKNFNSVRFTKNANI
jgi:hypothetical protein